MLRRCIMRTAIRHCRTTDSHRILRRPSSDRVRAAAIRLVLSAVVALADASGARAGYGTPTHVEPIRWRLVCLPVHYDADSALIGCATEASCEIDRGGEMLWIRAGDRSGYRVLLERRPLRGACSPGHSV
jgi:hypothetical protein